VASHSELPGGCTSSGQSGRCSEPSWRRTTTDRTRIRDGWLWHHADAEASRPARACTAAKCTARLGRSQPQVRQHATFIRRDQEYPAKQSSDINALTCLGDRHWPSCPPFGPVAAARASLRAAEPPAPQRNSRGSCLNPDDKKSSRAQCAALVATAPSRTRPVLSSVAGSKGCGKRLPVTDRHPAGRAPLRQLLIL
jgi:hypothetical protein